MTHKWNYSPNTKESIELPLSLAPSPLPIPTSRFPAIPFQSAIRSFLTGHSGFAPTIKWKMRSEEEGERAGGRKRKNGKERGKEMLRYTGSRSYRLFLYPREDYLFRFPVGRAPRRSPYCDSVIVVRFWKIAHCESVLKTGGFTESTPSHHTSIWNVLRPYRAYQERIDQSWFSYDFYHVFVYLRILFICR